LRKLISSISLAVAVACATAAVSFPRDLFGVRTGMRKADAQARLAAIGKLIRSEGTRQEAWEVRDPRFRGAIVGYDAESKVRFITAVANESGPRIPYADVLDVAKAQHQTAGSAYTYRWTPPHARYTIVAKGNDGGVMYLTLRTTRVERENGEKEEDD
jgi:hypothetical protein